MSNNNTNIFHEYNPRNVECETCKKLCKMQETEDREREDYHEFVKVCTQVQQRQYVDASVGDFYRGNVEKLRIKNKNQKANSQKNAFEYEWI